MRAVSAVPEDGARRYSGRFVTAAKTAAKRYTTPTIRLPQYGPVKPGSPWLGGNQGPEAKPKVQIPNMVGSSPPLTGFQLQPSQGSAVKNAATSSNATTPIRSAPRVRFSRSIIQRTPGQPRR